MEIKFKKSRASRNIENLFYSGCTEIRNIREYRHYYAPAPNRQGHNNVGIRECF